MVGVTQEQLTESLGTTQRMMTYWEREPAGRTKRVHERVSQLPRQQQKKILDVVAGLVAQTSQRAMSRGVPKGEEVRI